MNKTKDAFVGSWVTKEMLDRLKEAAAEEDRTVSSYVRRLIVEALRERDVVALYLPSEGGGVD